MTRWEEATHNNHRSLGDALPASLGVATANLQYPGERRWTKSTLNSQNSMSRSFIPCKSFRHFLDADAASPPFLICAGKSYSASNQETSLNDEALCGSFQDTKEEIGEAKGARVIDKHRCDEEVFDKLLNRFRQYISSEASLTDGHAVAQRRLRRADSCGASHSAPILHQSSKTESSSSLYIRKHLQNEVERVENPVGTTSSSRMKKVASLVSVSMTRLTAPQYSSTSSTTQVDETHLDCINGNGDDANRPNFPTFTCIGELDPVLIRSYGTVLPVAPQGPRKQVSSLRLTPEARQLPQKQQRQVSSASRIRSESSFQSKGKVTVSQVTQRQNKVCIRVKIPSVHFCADEDIDHDEATTIGFLESKQLNSSRSNQSVQSLSAASDTYTKNPSKASRSSTRNKCRPGSASNAIRSKAKFRKPRPGGSSARS